MPPLVKWALLLIWNSEYYTKLHSFLIIVVVVVVVVMIFVTFSF